MAIREGAWDCPSCGHKGLPGSRKYCGACGNVRGDDVSFYLPEGSREITEEEELRRATAGPDWKCPYCGGDNPSFNSHCNGCGSSQDGAEKRATKLILEHKAEPVANPTSGWNRVLVGCSLLVLLFFVGCWFLGRTSQEVVAIQSMEWQHTVDVETLGLVTQEGWEGKREVPGDAKVLSRDRQVREYRKIQTGTKSQTRLVSEKVETGTEKIKVGTKDLGNGYFEDVYEERPIYSTRQVEQHYDAPVYREEPVYDIKVRYQVERWQKTNSVTLNGTDNNPIWPTPEVTTKERLGPKHSQYTIVLKGHDTTYTYSPEEEAVFRSFSIGQSVEATVGFGGSVSELKLKK